MTADNETGELLTVSDNSAGLEALVVVADLGQRLGRALALGDTLTNLLTRLNDDDAIPGPYYDEFYAIVSYWREQER